MAAIYTQIILVASLVYTTYQINSYLIKNLSSLCWMFVFFDCGLIVYTCLNGSSEYGATTGAFQWSWYCTLLILKGTCLYFHTLLRFSSNELMPQMSVAWYGAVHTLCLPYLLWMIRAYYQLFGTKRFLLNCETFLFTDIVCHVCADLIDASVCLSFLFDSGGMRQSDIWVLIFNGLIIPLAWSLHMYSFPTKINHQPIGEASGIGPNGIGPSGIGTSGIGTSVIGTSGGRPVTSADVLLTRKWVALVSVFAIDLPLIVVRSYIWINYPYSPGLQAFLLKNVISLPLSVFRFAQCRRLDQSSRATAGASSEQAEDRQKPGGNQKVLSPLGGQESLLKYDSPFSNPCEFAPMATSNVVNVRSSQMKTSKLSEVVVRESDQINVVGIDQKTTKMIALIEQAHQTIPVKGSGFLRVIQKTARCLTHAVSSSHRSRIIVVGCVCRSEVCQLMSSLFFTVLSRLVTPILVLVAVAHSNEDSSALNTFNERVPSNFEIHQGGWMLIFMAAGGIIFALPLIGLCKFHQLIISAIVEGAKLSLWWNAARIGILGTLQTVVSEEQRENDDQLEPSRFIVTPRLRPLALIICLVPLSRLLRYLYLLSCWYGEVKLQRNRAVEPVAAASEQRKSYIMNDFVKMADLPNTDVSTVIAEFTSTDPPPFGKTYESHFEPLEHLGYVKMTSLIFLCAIKHTCVPIAFNRRLVSTDVLKSTRMVDVLLQYNTGKLLLHFLLAVMAASSLRDVASIFSGACALLILTVYQLYCHAQRLSALRIVECRNLTEKLISDFEGSKNFSVDVSKSAFVLTSDPRQDAFFSSPGQIWAL